VHLFSWWCLIFLFVNRIGMSAYFGTSPLWTWVNIYSCCDPSSTGTLIRVKSLEYICWVCYHHQLHVRNLYLAKKIFWWGTYRTDICHNLTYACAWIRWTLKTINSMEVKTERNLTLLQNVNRIFWVLPTLIGHNFLVRNQKYWILPLVRKVIKFSMILVFKVTSVLWHAGVPLDSEWSCNT
jgi:hypothetical protein